MVEFAAVHCAVKNHHARRRAHLFDGKAGASRRKAQAAELAAGKRQRELVAKYDSDCSGQLDLDQVRRLLSETCGQEVAKEEAEYFWKRFDRSGQGGISRLEVEGMLVSFHCYMNNKAEADKYMAKYDTSKTGSLSRSELKALMIDLNGGEAVSEEEVDFVLNQADLLGDGRIAKPEIVRAVTMWYAYVEDHKACCAIL
mmetsp:Transcript_56198/g.176095  ORF Transcript_56198/g.176095 Transcript_56198/m.176095 type:complete len:199 (-) Transcript_56198:89-685(-)